MKTLSFLFVLALACGGVVTTDPEVVPGQPPAPPVDGAPASSVTETFELDRLFLGDQARDGSAPSETAWRSFGYDLDHLVTTKDSTNVCARAAGGHSIDQRDGDTGIDNAWGSVIVPILQTLVSMQALSDDASSALAVSSTLRLTVTGLLADPSASAVGLELVTSFEKSASRFDASYVSHGTFVSGAGDSPLMLAIPFVVNDAAVVFPLAIHGAIVTFTESGDAIAGTLAGVLDVGEVTAAVQALANQKWLDSLARQVAQASDILHDGTNEPGVTCDAISIGIGFTAHATP